MKFITCENWEFLRLPLWNSGNFCHFDSFLIANHKVYYKKESGDSCQICVMMCLVIINYLWFIHAPFRFQFALITLFFSLCKLISFWTQACELILKLTHTIFMWNIINVICIPLCHFFSFSYLLQYLNKLSSINIVHYNPIEKLMKN